MGKLPQHYADMVGWEEKAAAVARAFQELTPDEQATCALFTNNYGRAGTIDFFGKKYGLSKAICNHNNYWLWGPRDYMGELVIILGGKLKDHEEHFTSVEIVETVQCEYCMPYEDNVNVYVCRGLKMPLKDAWLSIKSFN
jgi:hypothetical protein